jgi:hypothetical protein
MSCPRPWQVGGRFGSWGTEVADANGDLVCIVVTHERVKADDMPVVWVATEDGARTLAAILEAGAK